MENYTLCILMINFKGEKLCTDWRHFFLYNIMVCKFVLTPLPPPSKQYPLLLSWGETTIMEDRSINREGSVMRRLVEQAFNSCHISVTLGGFLTQSQVWYFFLNYGENCWNQRINRFAFILFKRTNCPNTCWQPTSPWKIRGKGILNFFKKIKIKILRAASTEILSLFVFLVYFFLSFFSPSRRGRSTGLLVSRSALEGVISFRSKLFLNSNCCIFQSKLKLKAN